MNAVFKMSLNKLPSSCGLPLVTPAILGALRAASDSPPSHHTSASPPEAPLHAQVDRLRDGPVLSRRLWLSPVWDDDRGSVSGPQPKPGGQN